MRTSFSFRALLATCGALVLLLAVLAVVQYRWSTRIAAADAQREKEHLDAAAALFANEFNALAGDAATYLQNQAWPAVQSAETPPPAPKLFGEVYYLETSSGGASARQLTSAGFAAAASPPEWSAHLRCLPAILAQPAALVAPVFDTVSTESKDGQASRIVKRFIWRQDRCFAARLDLDYLRGSIFPQLIRRSFGETAAREYDFAVLPAGPSQAAIYGSPMRADLRKPFFSIPIPLRLPAPIASSTELGAQSAIIVRRSESVRTEGAAPQPDVLGSGAWQLAVTHKGTPLAEAFEQTRRRNLLFSLGVEALLVAAIAFLVVGARRMQQVAEQKMQFVAGVSHELRSPVSAIAMLSRNQADGLVAGPERVRQYGELIHQQSRRLNEMVEQTLQYAGIHSGLRPPARHEVDLPSLIHEAVEARREELARCGIEVEIALSPGLPPVIGDAKLLRTAFDNLLSNAQKHAGSGRWIRVSAGLSTAGKLAASGKEVWISVEDRGSGIDPADQAQIFEPFNRGRAAVEAQVPGSGLGLSLVRSAAEAHRGTVTVSSQPGQGSTFTMRLPV